MSSKKIGLIVQYYTFRNDMRDFIEEMNKHCDLVLFVERRDFEKIPSDIEKRIITSHKSSLFNKVWNLLYLLFGNIPHSKKNYKNWRRRRIDTMGSAVQRTKETFLLYLQLFLPTWIYFDTYIKHLQYNRLEISDIDDFISFTDVSNPYIIAQLLKEKKNLYTYVYSWDHIAKFHKFSRNRIHYLTWNEGIKEDLILLHDINPEKIRIVGSTQFTLIHRYTEEKDFYAPFSFPYIYFAASFGYGKIAKQEVKMVEHLCTILKEIDPGLKIVFRPYPLLGEWDIYAPLKKHENLVFHNYEQNKNFYDPLKKNMKDQDAKKGKAFTFTDIELTDKFNSIYNAKAIIHCGSTIGLEASYFKTPVVYLNYKNFDTGVSVNDRSHIGHSNGQRHLQKYLLLEEFENVVTSHDSLKGVLQGLLKNPEPFLAYNYKLSSQTPVSSMENLVKVFLKTMEKPV